MNVVFEVVGRAKIEKAKPLDLAPALSEIKRRIKAMPNVEKREYAKASLQCICECLGVSETELQE